jgi:sugar phosphate permease
MSYKPHVEDVEVAEDTKFERDVRAAKHIDNDKQALDVLGHEYIVVDKATSRKVFWMINRRVLPFMVAVYLMQSLDKATVSLSSIMGIIQDTHMTSSQFSWLGSILWFGYFAGEIFVNFLSQKVPNAKFVAVNVFIWGALTAVTPAVNSFTGLAVLRFLLGVFEACVMPYFLNMTQMWYTRDEQLVIIGLWASMPGVQIMVGGLLAYGVQHYTGTVMKSWQLLFLILGLVTVVLSMLIFFFLPSSPVDAKCFDEETRRIMVARVRANETGVRLNKKIKWYQIKEGLKDPMLYCYFAMQIISCFFTGGLSFFSNLIVSQFGFTYLQTQLLNIAQGGLVVIIMVGTMYAAQRTKQRLYTLLAIGWLPLVGVIIVMKVTPTPENKVGLLIAFYLTLFTWPIGDLVNGILSQNVGGSSKRSLMFTINFLAWSGGNAAAPQAFQNGASTHYRTAFIVNLVLFCIYYVVLLCSRYLLSQKNKKKREAAPKDENGEEIISHETAFADLTDKENPNFRYSV